MTSFSSTSSHAQTSHSSPWDMDGTEMIVMNSHMVADQRTSDSNMNTFILVESPRDIRHCSSDQENHAIDSETLSLCTSNRFKQSRRCRRCHINGIFCTRRCLSWCPLIRIIIPPSIIIVLTLFHRSYLLMVILDAVIAFGGLELSWWHYRTRERLLAPFKNQHPTQQERNGQVAQQSPASLIATKFGRGSKYSIVFVFAGIMACLTALVCITYHSYFLVQSNSSLGWIILTISASFSVFTTLSCVFFAPTITDAFIVLVYGICFTVSSLNSFLAHHEKVIRDPELLDSLYVLLVGACTIILWRIVSSKHVLESMMMVMMDIFGLVYLVAPSMSISDFLGSPLVMVHDRLVMFFFVIVAAAEGGSCLHTALRRAYPQLSFSHCHRSTLFVSLDVERFVCALITASIAACVAEFLLQSPIQSVTSGFVMAAVVLFSQYCRLALFTMMDLAKVTNSDQDEQRHWMAGVMETVNPYLLATIVFHPYAKSFLSSTVQT